MATWWTQLTKSLISQISKKNSWKLLGVNSIEGFIAKWAKLTPQQRDIVRKQMRSNTRELQRIEKLAQGRLLKKELGKKLSTNDGQIIDMYEEFAVNEISSEKRDVRGGWIITAEYFPQTKTVFLNTIRGRLLYPFFGVPKTEWMRLTLIGGKKMWDDFGRKYSANPNRWIRQSSRN